MTRLLKTWLLCLLIAALPAQGVASVLKAACRCAPPAVSMHGAGHDHAAMLAQMKAHDSAPDDGAGPAHKETCSACAACSVGAAALPAAAVLPDFFPPSLDAALTAASFPPGHVPPRLERPPRCRGA